MWATRNAVLSNKTVLPLLTRLAQHHWFYTLMKPYWQPSNSEAGKSAWGLLTAGINEYLDGFGYLTISWTKISERFRHSGAYTHPLIFTNNVVTLINYCTLTTFYNEYLNGKYEGNSLLKRQVLRFHVRRPLRISRLLVGFRARFVVS